MSNLPPIMIDFTERFETERLLLRLPLPGDGREVNQAMQESLPEWKETGELAFCGGLHRMDWHSRKFELGYWLRSKYVGKGIATEAVRGLENLAIEQLGANRIEIQCDSENTRSIEVAKRLGYTLEGKLRNHALDAKLTNLRNTLMFAKVRGFEF